MREKQLVVGAGGGALGLGTLAAGLAACCGVPWVVALLGVSGAVAFARLAFLVPYALAGSALLLALGFWWAYRRPVACVDGACESTNRRALQWFMWTATILIAALWIVLLATGVSSIPLSGR